MEIEDQREPFQSLKFKNLLIGDVFQWYTSPGLILMKVDHSRAVCLSDTSAGLILYLDTAKCSLVTKLKAKLVLED